MEPHRTLFAIARTHARTWTLYAHAFPSYLVQIWPLPFRQLPGAKSMALASRVGERMDRAGLRQPLHSNNLHIFAEISASSAGLMKVL